MAKKPTDLEAGDDYLSCRIPKATADKFREKAMRDERRRPSQMLRLLVESFVEGKSATRPLATAK